MCSNSITAPQISNSNRPIILLRATCTVYTPSQYTQYTHTVHSGKQHFHFTPTVHSIPSHSHNALHTQLVAAHRPNSGQRVDSDFHVKEPLFNSMGLQCTRLGEHLDEMITTIFFLSMRQTSALLSLSLSLVTATTHTHTHIHTHTHTDANEFTRTTM